MLCQGFKGVTGTSSRVVPGVNIDDIKTSFCAATLVEAGYGRLHHLHIAGLLAGRILKADYEKGTTDKANMEGYEGSKNANDASIIIVMATDAPLVPVELQRLAKRQRVASVESVATDTPRANRDVDSSKARPMSIETIEENTNNALLEAAAEATEEVIYNALCMAETMVGFKQCCVESLPLDRVKDTLENPAEIESSITR